MALRPYTADFETVNDVDDCRVWAAAVCDLSTFSVEIGDSIEWFMGWCEDHASCQLYFHNLAFDGYFIIDWLERHGWYWLSDGDDPGPMSYSTVISDMNQVYAVTLYFNAVQKVRIYDSLKVIPMSVDAMARAFGLSISKGQIDYNKPRPIGYLMTDEERDYISTDVEIAARAMSVMLSNGMSRMTAGSNALGDYKALAGGHRRFRYIFPVIEDDADDFIRKAYKGGFTWANPRFAGKPVGKGIVVDANSMYPSVMYGVYGEQMPVGEPVFFEGSPFASPDARRPLWVAAATVRFKVREDHIPCIQLKGNMRFNPVAFLEESDGEVTFSFTNVDYSLFMEQYEFEVLEWHGGYRFQSNDRFFKSYIDKWMGVKVEAGREGNKGMRSLAKLMLNSLYGKFGTRKEVCSRRPLMVDGVVRYVDLPPERRDAVYLPVAVFTTSYARAKMVRSAQANFPRFLYADTDSMHLLGTDPPEGIDIDDSALGQWKVEGVFDRAKYLGPKCYIEDFGGSLTVHVSGLPAKCHGNVTFDNFHVGAVYGGKLYQKKVAGGIVLQEGTMEIKERMV